MSALLQRFWKPKPSADMTGDYTSAYKVKTRFGMLGPVASGKSTIAAALTYTCENLSSLVPNFYCHVLPTSTHILADANNLRLGRFPEKTDPFQPRAPEAGFLIESGWHGKKVQVPICDVAGEISDYIAAKASGYTAGQIIKQRYQSINQQVVETVKDCQGFIIALAAPEALMFRESASTFDPDVYTHTVLNEIFEYRRRNKRADPHIIVVLTKWDQIAKQAKDIAMNVYDEGQDGMGKFLANGFPATSMLLKPLRDRGFVKYFRSWFKIKTRDDGSPMMWENTNKPVIDLIEDEEAYLRFRPNCSEQDYADMVKHIGSFAK
jgi:hypothetical protein